MPDALVVAILAAGASRRLGRPKQLVELRGEPVIRRQCRIAIEASIGRVVAVIGCEHERVAAALNGLPVHIIVNDEWEEGMAASVRAATRAALSANADALLLFHGDQYAIASTDLLRLRQAWAISPTSACLSRDGDHLGPPAILPARLFSRMLTLAGDTGPRAILRGDSEVREVHLASASRDIDESIDLIALASND